MGLRMISNYHKKKEMKRLMRSILSIRQYRNRKRNLILEKKLVDKKIGKKMKNPLNAMKTYLMTSLIHPLTVALLQVKGKLKILI